MSNASNSEGKALYRAAIEAFLQDRLQARLGKQQPDDSDDASLRESFNRKVWLESAAKRVQQIQAVTHSLKPIHPDARGTNLYRDPATLPALSEVGSHALGHAFDTDVVGNAAALDVYKLLKLEVNGRTLLSALLEQDEAALAALDDDAGKAAELCDAFVSLTQPRSGAPSSHTFAKQLYWLSGHQADDDSQYVLLAPLFATSLAHAVHGVIQEDRFGDDNKAARQARKARKMHDGVFRDYPGLAVRKMGGTKPQNISQLNSERGGVNYLLSSLPPQWKIRETHWPVNTASVFDGLFIGRPQVRQTLHELREFLASDPESNLATRRHRSALVDTLLDELVSLAGSLHQGLEPGWSRDDTRFESLALAEKLWLDPFRAEIPEEAEFAAHWLRMDWPDEIGHRFAQWLNHQLKGLLSVGDVEARHWKTELLTDEDGFKQQLRELRTRLDAPHYIPIRKPHSDAPAGATP